MDQSSDSKCQSSESTQKARPGASWTFKVLIGLAILALIVIIPSFVQLWFTVFTETSEKYDLANNSSDVLHLDVVILPNGTWTRVSNKSSTYYMLAESKDDQNQTVKKFDRDTCISMCEESGEGSKLGSLTNDNERLGFLKIRKDLGFPEGFYWVDAQRVNPHQKSKPGHVRGKMKKESDIIIARDYRESWYWKGDTSLPIGQEDKWWFSANYPQLISSYFTNKLTGRGARDFGAYKVGNDTSGIANDRYANEKNGCLCEFRFQNE